MILGVRVNFATVLAVGFKVTICDPVKSPTMAIVLEPAVPPVLVAIADTVTERPNCICCGLIKKSLSTILAGVGGGGGGGLRCLLSHSW